MESSNNNNAGNNYMPVQQPGSLFGGQPCQGFGQNIQQPVSQFSQQFGNQMHNQTDNRFPQQQTTSSGLSQMSSFSSSNSLRTNLNQGSNFGPQQPQPNGTDVHLNSLKVCFKQAANSLTQLYKQSTFSYNIAYQQGRQDAFEEVFQWFVHQTSAAASSSEHMKNVSKNEFMQFISDKIQKQKDEAGKAHDENQAFIQQLMPPPPNRQPSTNYNTQLSNASLRHQAHQVATSDLIEMAANQSINEDAQNNGGIKVVQKVNINFQALKLNDSKKRIRQTGLTHFGINGDSGIHQQNINNNEASSMSDVVILSNPGGEINGGGMNGEFDQLPQGNENDYSRKVYKAKRLKNQGTLGNNTANNNNNQ